MLPYVCPIPADPAPALGPDPPAWSSMVRHIVHPIGASVVGALLLVGCSSTPPAPHPPTQSATVRPSSSATPGVCGGPCFPATDTLFTEASTALQAAWKKYRVEIIPGQDVVA